MSFRLTDKRYEQIKTAVADTFVKLGIKSVPISGFEMATRLGAVIIPYSAKSEKKRAVFLKRSEDGFSSLKDGVWHIFYNDKMLYGRINMTLLHECGHIILDHTEQSELAEAEANFFAKYAIAPPPLVKKLGLKSFEDIYETFDITHEAAFNSFNYYKKWLSCGRKNYTDYEMKILRLFADVC